jgi:hypothetical protein
MLELVADRNLSEYPLFAHCKNDYLSPTRRLTKLTLGFLTVFLSRDIDIKLSSVKSIITSSAFKRESLMIGHKDNITHKN